MDKPVSQGNDATDDRARGGRTGWVTLAILLLALEPAVPGWSGIAFGADAPFWTNGSVRGGEDTEVARLNRAVTGLARQLNPAVVQIGISGGPAAREESETPGERPRVGSGFIIHPSGYIVTNNHVIEQAASVEIHLLDQRKFPAKVLGKDARTDLALLKIDPPSDLPAIPLGDSDALEVGELVLALGNPFGLGHTVTMGIVSRKGPGLRPGGPFDEYIQTDASINPGNSGGPLVNSRGEAVGVVTAVVPNRRVGFAVPINLAKGLLPELREKGKIAWGFLGVGIQNLTEEMAKAFDLKEGKGVLVNNIIAGLPAAAAGLKRGDVIVAFDGQDIPDLRALQRLVSRTPVGKQVQIRIMRGGRPEIVTATVAEAGAAGRALAARGGVPARDLGFQVDDVDSEAAKKFKLPKDEEGVVVTEVTKGGPAAAGGLRAGDVVREVNRQSVASVEAFRGALRGAEDPGAADLFLIKRGEGYLYVTVRPKT